VSAQLRDDTDDSTSARTPIVDVQPRVDAAFELHERVRVFILLREDTLAMDERQDGLVAALGGELDLWHRYDNIPAIAGELSRAGLVQLRRNAAVRAVQLDSLGSGGLIDAVPAAGVDKVHSLRGLTGKGITVAVLDSGASTMHPALKTAIVAQHCFTAGACPPDNARESESAEDDHGHGSNVSGIVASRGSSSVGKGYAPAAKIVAVKVLNSKNTGLISDWVAGFDWVLTNREKLDVRVINASLVGPEYATSAECDGGESAMSAVIHKLIDAGVTIAASSGNTGQTVRMSTPACISGVIAVGATYDKDLGRQPRSSTSYRALAGDAFAACSDSATSSKTMACFTSTGGPRLDLLAPGALLTSAGSGTSTSTFAGTSQASPGVAGLAALLLECNPTLTPARILDVLKRTGEPITDTRTNMTYPLIRGFQAANAACGERSKAVPLPGVATIGGYAAHSGSAGTAESAAGSGERLFGGGGGMALLALGPAGTAIDTVPARGLGREPVLAAGHGGDHSAARAGRVAADGGRSSPPAAAGSGGHDTRDTPSESNKPAQPACQCSTPGSARHSALSFGWLWVAAMLTTGGALRRRTS
jgi:subtilisin family serine protease